MHKVFCARIAANRSSRHAPGPRPCVKGNGNGQNAGSFWLREPKSNLLLPASVRSQIEGADTMSSEGR
jgi:hypothetical protein